MKTLYFWTTILSVIGVFTSLYLIPNDADVAFLHLKTKNFQQAKVYYQNKYKKEGAKPQTLHALSQIEERQGNIQKAIRYMEEYTRASPKDSKAYRRLADLYLIDHNMPKYLQALLRLEQLSPKKIDSPLHELVSWYLANNDPKLLKVALEKLINLQYAKADDYLLLATIYANEKRYEEALQLLKVRRAFFSKVLSIDEILLEIHVMESLGISQEERISLFTKYLFKQKDPKSLHDAVQLFTSHYPDQTKELIETLEVFAQEHPNIQVLFLLSQQDKIDSEKLFLNFLQKEADLYKDNPALQNLTFVAFVEKGNIKALEKLLEITPIENIEERNITYAAVLALEQKSPHLLLPIKNSYSKEYLEKNLTLQALLSISSGEERGKQLLQEGIEKKLFTPLKSYFLLQVATKAGMEKEALALGDNLLPYHGRSLEELLEVISCYTALGQARKLELDVINHQSAIGKKRTNLLLAALAIPLGKTRETAEFVKFHTELGKNTLYALYTLAAKYHKSSLSLYLAKRISTQYPSKRGNIFYGESLVRAGKADKGLSILEELYHTNPEDEQSKKAYLSSLILAAKKNRSYIPRLKRLIKKVKSDPLLQRDLALAELEVLHNFVKAKEIYFSLLQTPTHRGEDIATFTYLVGPKASQKEILFVVSQAKISSSALFPFWLEGLVFMGQNQAIIDLCKERSDALTLKSSFALINSLNSQKQYQALSFLLPRVLEQAHSLEEIKRLASYSLAAGDLLLEQKILQKGVSSFPDDLFLWESLGRSYYDSGNFNKSLLAIEKFFSMEGASAVKDLYQSYYRYGEILYTRREYERARGYFIFSLKELKKQDLTSFSSLSYKVLVLYRLGEGHKAQKVAKRLYNLTAQDEEAAAVYGSLLLDLGKLQEAGCILKKGKACP